MPDSPDPTCSSSEVDELEHAYREALKAIDAAEEQVGEVLNEFSGEETSGPETGRNASEDDSGPTGVVSIGELSLESGVDSDRTAVSSEIVTHPGDDWVDPVRIIEAALFVGGTPLTAIRLCRVLGVDLPVEEIVRIIERLNERYEAERRPYEIQPGEGGYRLRLKPDFQAVQRQTFGFGPRDVRLSQEVLEVLAFVAYRQPVTKEDFRDSSRPAVEPVLRQLVRRRLIKIDRDEDSPKTVQYRTTERFLEVFGLQSLNELPRDETFALR